MNPNPTRQPPRDKYLDSPVGLFGELTFSLVGLQPLARAVWIAASSLSAARRWPAFVTAAFFISIWRGYSEAQKAAFLFTFSHR